ncbi:hypothetical protein CAPTEDRAFT_192383 [Capitella teleta]|uniref:Uncharacterized protein n=1 Tax=Capitella teleta TaxID=283909 RepID=R7U249_CAPTE|nr:hypothetical protein CAPTEDRAFT_192383 [Capitella teleta]|eukprot:ELT97245.1 hypothetical protein CAPTEDRAFT_192383 [Capitella teleta]
MQDTDEGRKRGRERKERNDNVTDWMEGSLDVLTRAAENRDEWERLTNLAALGSPDDHGQGKSAYCERQLRMATPSNCDCRNEWNCRQDCRSSTLQACVFKCILQLTLPKTMFNIYEGRIGPRRPILPTPL